MHNCLRLFQDSMISLDPGSIVIVLLNNCLTLLEQPCISSSHFHGTPFFTKFSKGAIFSACLLLNFEYKCTSPRKPLSCLKFFGVEKSAIPCTFSRFGFISSVVRTKPRNLVSFLKKFDLLRSRVQLFYSSRIRRSSICSRFCCTDFDVTRVSATNEIIWSPAPCNALPSPLTNAALIVFE